MAEGEKTPKQRMLNAYRGVPNDRAAVAPEFWYYYPAKLLGVDMIDFWKTPFHRSLKFAFEKFGTARQGGMEAAVYDLAERADQLERLQERHIDFVVRKARAVCQRTPFESLFIGCTWSCLSLISPAMWRKWDKPVIRAVCDEVHRHGRLLHIHFHGKCMAVVDDFAELGIDCVDPFERPPGGDVAGLAGLCEVARRLAGRTTMSGNVHTVETLIRGGPDDVRREVREIQEAFAGNPRVIIGTGDQAGAETPEANLLAMFDQGRKT